LLHVVVAPVEAFVGFATLLGIGIEAWRSHSWDNRWVSQGNRATISGYQD